MSTPSANTRFDLSLGHHFKAFAAAHAFLQIVPPFRECVVDDRQHRIVSLRIENVSGADENLHLIGLGPRLIESFGQIVQD